MGGSLGYVAELNSSVQSRFLQLICDVASPLSNTQARPGSISDGKRRETDAHEADSSSDWRLIPSIGGKTQ